MIIAYAMLSAAHTPDTGYYDNDGQLQYSYTIPKDKREWITYDSPLLQ